MGYTSTLLPRNLVLGADTWGQGEKAHAGAGVSCCACQLLIQWEATQCRQARRRSPGLLHACSACSHSE